MYRKFSPNKIQFLTHHRFNDSIHTLIIEFFNFTFSKIIDYRKNDQRNSKNDYFSLFYLVNVTEYEKFRNRVLELENINNSNISDFKTKMDKLESIYKQKVSDNNIILAELNASKNSEDKLKIDLTQKEKEIDLLQKKVKDFEKKQSNTKIINNNNNRLILLINQERQLKRDAIRENKELSKKIEELQSFIEEIKIIQLNKGITQEKALTDLQSLKDNSEHSLILYYEQKISELTLLLHDKEEQLKFVKNNQSGVLEISNESQSDKDYREKISHLFIKMQNKFSEFQYDIMLSFYNTENFDPQIRNAFEKFFEKLIQKCNKIGRTLLKDDNFSLFRDLRKLNTRFRFSQDQLDSALQLQALNIVFSDLCIYIFSIIKIYKAKIEENNFVIVPDDAKIIALIQSSIIEEKIVFRIPLNEQTSFNKLRMSLRIFRPTSELYKNSFIFIASETDSTIFNNSYQLIPFQIKNLENELILEIENFYSEKDVFQLCSFYDNNYFIIQKLEYQKEFNLVREFACKNSIEYNSFDPRQN
jgi:hypothetical protein